MYPKVYERSEKMNNMWEYSDRTVYSGGKLMD